MPIVLKLKHYRADEEKEPWLLRGSLSLFFAVVVAAIVYSSVSTVGPAASSPCLPQGSPRGPAVAYVQTFQSANWRHLEKGQASVRYDRLDTDLNCPDWQGREELKGLKAMAVYEAKGGEVPTGEEEETKRMAEMIRGGNPR
jgi:hypothetical protein